MSNVWGRITAMVIGMLLMATTARAQAQINLTPFLQAEVNEVAALTAQSNYLLQQGDPLGASVLASYIPDHRMMIDRLCTVIMQQGGNPNLVQPAVTPFLGTRTQIMEHQLQRHAQVRADYQNLFNGTNDPTIKQLANLGRSGAWRHFDSLRVARAATLDTPAAITDGLIASLALERSAILDLQTQAAVLNAMGDQTTASMLQNMITAHQQQAANLQNLITQMGGDINQAVPPPVVAFTTRNEILAHFNVLNTQMVNTYAIPLAALPSSPLRQIIADGQLIALTSLTALQRPVLA